MTNEPAYSEAQRLKLAEIGSAFRFAGDRLTFDATHPGTHKLYRKTLSPSSTNSLSTCPANWAIDYLMPEEPDPFATNTIGTAAHAVMEDLMGLPAAERTRARANDLLNGLEERHSKLIVPSDPLSMGRWRAEIAARVDGLFTIEDPTQVIVVGRELRVDVQIDGVAIGGLVDRLDAIPDGKGCYTLAVRDYKTGKFKSGGGKFVDTGAEQQRLYSIAIELLGLDWLRAQPGTYLPDGLRPVVTEASLYFTAHGKARKIGLTPVSRAKTRARFVAAWQTMQQSLNAGSFPATPQPLCGWCPLVALCPSAIADGKVDKSGKSALGELLNLGGPPPMEPPHTVRAAEPTIGGTSMTATPAPHTIHFSEGNRYEETRNGHLNASSAAATAAFGLTSMAADILTNRGQKIGASLLPFAQTLNGIVAELQARYSGNQSLDNGLHTRLRGVLHTVLEMPGTQPPFGGTYEQWTAWRTAVINRMDFIVQSSHALWANPASLADPLAALVGTTVPTPAAPAAAA